MILLDQIQGHPNVVENFRRTLGQGSLPHALLFFGPEGVGKKTLAVAVAQGLLCTSKPKPCGKCSSCQKISTQNHPDLLMVAPDGASIKVEQIRNVLQFCSFKSYEGQGKVIILEDAHLLGAQAGNALLKTLEEPQDSTYFILITHQKGALLNTIQSRCQKVGFGVLPREVVGRITKAEDWVLDLAYGQISNARKYQDPQFSELRKTNLKILSDLFDCRTFEGFQSLVDVYEERDGALFTVQCWLRIFSLAQAEALNVARSVSNDEKELVKRLASRLNFSKLEKMGEKALQLEQDILNNIHKALAFEQFWLEAKGLIQ